MKHITKMLNHLFLIPIAILACGVGTARAQLIGELKADIPFTFHAGMAKLPPGQYIFYKIGYPMMNVMEIRTPNASISTLIEIRQSQADNAPKTNELIFHQIGSRYYLWKIFDSDDKYGAVAEDVGYSKLAKEVAMKGDYKDVPATHDAKAVPPSE